MKIFRLTSTISYLAETGCYVAAFRLLNDLVSNLPGPWKVLLQFALPVFLVLALRQWAGESWGVSDLGLVRPGRDCWLEAAWLLCFQTTYLLGILLLLARYRFYYLLDFFQRARAQVNGYPAEYGAFIFSIALFSSLSLSWGGELLHRGYIQGLATTRFSAAAGGFASWLSSAAAWCNLALGMNYPVSPDVLLWGLFALLPGPLFEAFYFRNGTLLPLMGIRALALTTSFASTGFFLYWYPDRSFAAAMPVFWSLLILLAIITAIGMRKVQLLWATAWTMLWTGLGKGALPGICLAALLIVNASLGTPQLRLGFCAAMLVLIWSRRRPTAQDRAE